MYNDESLRKKKKKLKLKKKMEEWKKNGGLNRKKKLHNVILCCFRIEVTLCVTLFLCFLPRISHWSSLFSTVGKPCSYHAQIAETGKFETENMNIARLARILYLDGIGKFLFLLLLRQSMLYQLTILLNYVFAK